MTAAPRLRCSRCARQQPRAQHGSGDHLGTLHQSFDLFTNGTFIPNNETLPENSLAVTFYVIGAINESRERPKREGQVERPDYCRVIPPLLSAALDAPGHYWCTLDDFPTHVPQHWYLGPGGTLSTTAPKVAGSQSLIHDPSNPIPTNGGGNLFEACGPLDQAALEAERVAKGDMILFTSDILQKPLPVTGEPMAALSRAVQGMASITPLLPYRRAGPLFADIYVSSNCTDTDVMVRVSRGAAFVQSGVTADRELQVKLVDVHPNGFAALVQDSVTRMRRRIVDKTNVSQPMIPGEVGHQEWVRTFACNCTLNRFRRSTRRGLFCGTQGTAQPCCPRVLCLQLPAFFPHCPRSWIFNAGHQLRLEIASSNYPRFGINPNNDEVSYARTHPRMEGDYASPLPICNLTTLHYPYCNLHQPLYVNGTSYIAKVRFLGRIHSTYPDFDVVLCISRTLFTGAHRIHRLSFSPPSRWSRFVGGKRRRCITCQTPLLASLDRTLQLPKFPLLENAFLGLAHRIRSVYAQNADNLALEVSSLARIENELSWGEALRLERLRAARRRAAELASEDIRDTAAWVKARLVEAERNRELAS